MVTVKQNPSAHTSENQRTKQKHAGLFDIYAYITRRNESNVYRTRYLEQSQNLLTQVVVEVGVLGLGHVVDEDETGALRLHTLQGNVQLIHNALQ